MNKSKTENVQAKKNYFDTEWCVDVVVDALVKSQFDSSSFPVVVQRQVAPCVVQCWAAVMNVIECPFRVDHKTQNVEMENVQRTQRFS